MKNWFRYIFYASLIFLVIALVRADYLVVPRILDPVKLILSLLLLFAGFLLNALSWSRVLRHTPAALLLGTIGIISVGGINLYGISVLSLFVLLSLVIFTPLFHRMADRLLTKILRKQVRVPRLPPSKVTRAMIWYLISWGTWSVAFWFLAASLVNGPLPVNIAFAFALGGSIGILSIFAPGGLGVREGILTAYLTLAGIAVQDATTIAVASRLWFLAGEIFIFFTALLLDRYRKSKMK
jgi:uncharacterized membrane protein YbhN (UPF0104 family)